MDLKRLKHVVALADERNFARAGELVHLSQSAFSRSIQAAEDELGFSLFDRGTTDVNPTPAGLFVIERARKLLFESRCMDHDIDLFRKNQIGNLAFGVGPFPAATVLPGIVSDLRNRYPGISVRIEVNNWSNLLASLRREELDFFVADIRDLPMDPDLDIKFMAKQLGKFFVRKNHPLLEKATISTADLLSYGFITVRLPKMVKSVLAEVLSFAPSAKLPIVLECDDVQTIKRATIDSDGVLGIVGAAVTRELAQGELAELMLNDMPPIYSEMGIVALRGRSHSVVAKFVIEQINRVV